LHLKLTFVWDNLAVSYPLLLDCPEQGAVGLESPAIFLWGGYMPQQASSKTPLYIVGSKKSEGEPIIPEAVSKDFLGDVQWKIWDPETIADLALTHRLIIGIDTMSPEEKRVFVPGMFLAAGEDSVMLYSSETNTAAMLGGVNGLIILNPS